MDFKSWINKKYIEWRGDSRRTISEFSVFLKISGATVNAWINGTRGAPTSQRLIQILVDKYGDDVYDILGMQRQKNDQVNLSFFPREFVDKLQDSKDEIENFIQTTGLSPDSVEAQDSILEILGRNGITVTQSFSDGEVFKVRYVEIVPDNSRDKPIINKNSKPESLSVQRKKVDIENPK